MDGHRSNGCVVVTRDAEGIAASFPAPAEVPPGASWQTIRGTTNALSGWDKVLEPFGVAVHW